MVDDLEALASKLLTSQLTAAREQGWHPYALKSVEIAKTAIKALAWHEANRTTETEVLRARVAELEGLLGEALHETKAGPDGMPVSRLSRELMDRIHNALPPSTKDDSIARQTLGGQDHG